MAVKRKSPTTPRMLLDATVEEHQLQANVLDLAARLGFIAYHTFDSRKSAPGFPDIIAVHPLSGRLIVAELKRETGKTTTAQELWLLAFSQVYGCEVYTWRPSDWLNGAIERVLTQQAAA